MSITDAATTIKDILVADWDSTKTGNNTPIIVLSFDVKRQGGFERENDYVVVYEVSADNEHNGFGGQSRKTEQIVSIEISTTTSRARAMLLMNEVDRITWARLVNPDANYALLEAFENWKDLSSGMTMVWKFVRDVRLIKPNEVRV